jgi:Fe2+ transport system protein FeoA
MTMTSETVEILTLYSGRYEFWAAVSNKKSTRSREIRQRLIDLGFVKNETGIVLRQALLKDPIEIEIKGTRVSLRRSEARLLMLRR